MLSRRDLGRAAAASMGAMAVMSSGEASAAEPVVSFNVLYPNHDGARFDMAYYRATHIPMCERIMKPASTLLIEGVAMGGNPAPFAMIVHFEFVSAEAMRAALGNPAMSELRDDLVKFSDIKPVILFGKSA